MSTVKIKTEPTTAAATVDVQVKLEQHTSDIDTKVESDSEEYIKSENDVDDDDEDEEAEQSQVSATSKKKRRVICEYPGCCRSFRSDRYLRMHRHEHRLQTKLNIYGKTYTLIRESLDDRWPCPIPDCEMTYKTVDGTRKHIRSGHGNTLRQQHHRQQQPLQQIARQNLYFLGVDDFYVNRVRRGYHNTIGVFICHECKLVPECLLTHLQQKHGYDEKLIDNAILPESARIGGSDPNGNQHTSNHHLASAVYDPYQWRSSDIIQGWLCITSNCGYSGQTLRSKRAHKRTFHQYEQISTVPALVLRLLYSKTQASYFLIARLDKITSSNNVNSSNPTNQYDSEFDIDNGDELVLSDYGSDEDDIH